MQTFKNLIKPKNLIIHWESPKVLVKKKTLDLGVINVNPDEYIAKYGNTLKRFDELPDFAKEIKPPENMRLASQTSGFRTNTFKNSWLQ